MKHPGKRIRELREASGLGVRELARKAGLASNATITRIESGASWGRARTLEAIAEALGVTADELRQGGSGTDGSLACDAIVSGDGSVIGPKLDSLESPALGADEPVESERISFPGAGPGWIAARLGQVTPDPVSRDPGADGAPRRWDLQSGDVVVFRPLPKGDDVPTDKLVIVERPEPGNEDDNVMHEVFVATRERGRVTLWPLNGSEQRGMPRGWRVTHVGVEQRRGI